MVRSTLLMALAVIVVWMAVALARVENERYALALGMCRLPSGMADSACLARAETRTSWAWHIWYALRG